MVNSELSPVSLPHGRIPLQQTYVPVAIVLKKPILPSETGFISNFFFNNLICARTDSNQFYILNIIYFTNKTFIFYGKSFYFKHRSVHMSIPNSQSIPSPHPSPIATINPFPESVSVFTVCK